MSVLPSRRETGAAVAVGLVAFAVYLRTLYPGLVGSGDTPELQFVGRVLGTAHTPGYPLYTLLAWCFSLLPIGTVAYRANLMSAVCAALAVGLLFVLLRRLGCRRAVAAATAWAFGFGRIFWSQATLAEVYGLAAVLLLATLLAVLAWADSRRDQWLLLAVGAAALAAAHHSSDIASVAPALVVFVVWTDPRAAARPRFLLSAAAVAALGLSLYGFILLRTWQAAPYLGSRASSLGELLDVMRGGRFGGRLFAFGPQTLLFERVPAFLRLIVTELSLPGLALGLWGFTLLFRRRRRDAALFVMGAAGVFAFALNYDIPDIAVFMIPVFVLLWPAVGVGLEACVEAASRWMPAAVAAPLALVLALWPLSRNFRVNDHRGRTFEMRYFQALLATLPPRAAIVSESYTVDQMVRYELFGEDYAAQKQIVFSGRDEESLAAYRRKDYELFAFEAGHDELASRGYSFAPLAIADRPLDVVLESAPPGAIVLQAGTGGQERGCSASIRVAGRGLARAGSSEAEVAVKAGELLPGSSVRAPAALRALCRGGGGVVEVGGRSVARSDPGRAAAVLNARGRVLERYELEVGEALVPFNRRAFPLYRLTGDRRCQEIGNRGFVDVSALASAQLLARVDNVRPFDAQLTLYVGRDRPFAPRLAWFQGRGAPRFDAIGFGPEQATALAQSLERDGLGRGQALSRERHVARLEVTINDGGESAALDFGLGGVPRRMLAAARVDRDEPRRATLCALPTGVPLFSDPTRRAQGIPMGQEGTPYLGAGWRPPELEPPMQFRWTAGSEAEVLLPLAHADVTALQLRVRPGPGASSLTLVVDGRPLGSRALTAGWADYEWPVPANLCRIGENQLLLRVSGARPPDGGALELAVSRLRLQRP